MFTLFSASVSYHFDLINLFFCLQQINTLASIRILIPNDLLPLEARENTLKKISEVLSRFPKGVPLLDPEEDMKVRNSMLIQFLKKIFSG